MLGLLLHLLLLFVLVVDSLMWEFVRPFELVHNFLPRREKTSLKTFDLVLISFSSKQVESFMHWNTTFGKVNVDIVLLCYEKEAYDAALSLHYPVFFAPGQMKFWYYKRLLTESVSQAYNYVHIIDSDVVPVRPSLLPLYLYTLRVSQPVLAQPSVMPWGRSTDHATLRHSNACVKRWTNVIEIGPFFSVRASHINRVFALVEDTVIIGYGLDFVWCMNATETSCLVVDAFPVHHLDGKSGSSHPEFFEQAAFETNHFRNLTHGNMISLETERVFKCELNY